LKKYIICVCVCVCIYLCRGKRLQKQPPLTRNLRVISVYKLPTLTCIRRYFLMEDPNFSVCVRATPKSDASVCKGDSGGPLLAYGYNTQNNQLQLRLVGIIIARVASPSDWSCNPGAIILGMKVKPFKSFIQRHVGSWRRW